MKNFLSAILLTMLCFQLNAQSVRSDEAQQDTLRVYFHQGFSTWDAEYMNNGKNLEAFVNRFQKLTEQDEIKKITKIHIVATCSPEGYYEFNKRLAKNRALSIRKVLSEYVTLPDSVIVERAIAINWDGLRKMVVADPNVPHREEVLDNIDNTPELYVNDEGKTQELRKQRLIWRFEGKAWKYMYDKFFPTLRSYNLQIIVEWEKLKLDKVTPILAQADYKSDELLFRNPTPPITNVIS